MTINRNQVLIAIGLLAAEGPDVATVAAWLPTLGIPHLTGLIHILGTLSLMLGGLALAWPRIRSILAAGGLATPPGAVAPWDPSRDAGPAAPVAPPAGLPGVFVGGPSDRKGGGYDKGSVSPLVLLVAFAVAVLGVVLVAKTCRADEPAPAPSPQLGFCVDTGLVCFQPAAAVSALQFNLKTGSYQRVALMAGYGGVYKGAVDLGAAVYVGVGIAADAPNAAQASLLLSFADVAAAGPGVQVFKDPSTGNLVWQGLLTVALNYNVGASPTYLNKTARNAAVQGEAVGLMKARASAGAK
ncbi:MAG TPA: hypothetical protein VJ801_17585 [Polyangia bacterium]|jgi:hypothetical protein|nr:hypothetical protein [Polyangia bacterium]